MRLIIDLDNGLYRLGFGGGEGKTYLCKRIGAKGVRDSKYLSLTYNEYVNIFDIISKVNDGVKVIALDRADLYMTEELYSLLCSLAETRIILVDVKNTKYRMRTAYVRFGEDYIGVWRK